MDSQGFLNSKKNMLRGCEGQGMSGEEPILHLCACPAGA